MKPQSRITAIFIVLVGLALAACNPSGNAPHPEQALPRVSVAEVISQRITEWDEFTGHVQAPETVELRPRVSGYIESVVFEEGSEVNAGEVLFYIDDRPFRARAEQLKAELASARSQYSLAEKEYLRAQGLLERNAIAQELRDDRQAAWEQAAARVDAVSAQLELAELDLSYTQVIAPISGRVSNALITRGNYVNAGQSILTSLVSTSEVYVYFDADEQTYIKYTRLDKEGSRPSSRTTPNPVYMGLATDQDFPNAGYIDFVDNHIEESTGTIRGRATFSNKNGALIPGMFARIKLVGSGSYQGILVDEKAIATDLSNKYVLVINDSNTLEYRQVVLGEKLNGLRIIDAGLQPHDQIVVNGMQHVRPGMVVDPQAVAMTTESTLNALAAQQRRIDQARQSTQYSLAHN